jgi:hypothetical protein
LFQAAARSDNEPFASPKDLACRAVDDKMAKANERIERHTGSAPPEDSKDLRRKIEEKRSLRS